MKKILIENTKGIRRLEFAFPEAPGVYLLAGANGVGKTTLLICMERICNSLAFARGFSTARYLNAVDQFENASILYETSDMRIRFRKKTARWAPTPRTGSSSLLQSFGYSDVIFVRADSKRIDISQDDLRAGRFVAADSEIKDTLNALMETQKYSRLMRLRNTNGRGRQASYYYTIKEADRMYYSEKRFSTGELALLRLVEQLKNKFTPEVWLIEKMEHPTESLKRSIQGKFHAEINQILQSQEYRDCTASAPRKLAKKRWDVVVKKLCETSGDSDTLVADSLISTIVHDIEESEVRGVLGPILRR